MKKTIHTVRAAALIGAIWLGSFLLALAVPCLLVFRSAIKTDTFSASIDEVSGMYAPFVGAILAYYLASRITHMKARQTSWMSFLLAVVVSCAWNIVAVGLLAQALTGSTGLEDSSKVAGEISRKLSWIVAPVMGYFFASDAKAVSRP